MMDIYGELAKAPLLFDGSMGIYYSSLYHDGTGSEQANLLHPERILSIHRQYLDAGAKAIKTNTFAANTAFLQCSPAQVERTIRSGWDIASEAAAPYDAYVFADIGPLNESEAEPEEYDHIIDLFLELGAKYFLFETFSDLSVQPRLAERIKSSAPDAFVLTSFASMAEGFTPAGLPVGTLLRQADGCPYIDGAGLNCIIGPGHMLKLVSRLRYLPRIFSVMPNAGYPTSIRGQMHYGGDPAYFAECMSELPALGAGILGGCCGTTPAFIEKTKIAINGKIPAEIRPASREESRPKAKNDFSDSLDTGRRVIALEIDPPAGDDIDFFVDGARRLCAAGADAITISDCPIARARADSSMLAAKLRRELGVDTIPHLTCRDRNITATRALLLGLSIEDVHNVLLVTGDPVPTSDREKIKTVYAYSSALLASFVRALGDEGSFTPFRLYGALNVNALHFDAELKKAQRKEESGISCFFTQPVFTEQAFDNLALASRHLTSPILGGIYPIVSYRNAVFMNSEVSGVKVSQEIIDRYKGLSAAESEELAVTLAVESAERMIPYTSGWYLITPFRRVELMERILNMLVPLKNQ